LLIVAGASVAAVFKALRWAYYSIERIEQGVSRGIGISRRLSIARFYSELTVAGRTTQSIHLRYGRSASVDVEVEESRIRGVFSGPPACADARERLRSVLDTPLDFPPLEQAVIPDDRITLVLDRDVPGAAMIIAEVWQRLRGRGVKADAVTILQPADQSLDAPSDPRSELPADVREAVSWQVHVSSPEEEGGLHYLATTAAGERIYLNAAILDADVIISIGRMGFDPLLGYRGTNSAFYPGLSTAEAVKRAHGQGHSELGSDDERPLRQLVDEVGWLLGTQFTIQVIPAVDGGVAEVLAGSIDSVFRKGREELKDRWTFTAADRAETVVVAIDEDVGGHGWNQVSAALAVARRLVAREGRVIVLSQLAAPSGEGIEMLRRAEEPRDAFRPLRQVGPADLIAATQFAQAVDWSRVYLLSQLDSDLVEDLFCVPVENVAEVGRLLAADEESCMFIGSAQHVDGKIG
jgi:nickel-dependent lactate racemase